MKDTPTYTHTCGFVVCRMMGRFGYDENDDENNYILIDLVNL